MKKLIRIAILYLAALAAAPILAQETRGVQPVAEKPAAAPTGTTYAVIAGISDYENTDITDLRYAHVDAQAFAEYLRSPAGGSVPENQLTVLLNEQASLGQFAAALDGLLEKAKENDLIFIYFSGHGDVERKTISQPGFLLCWNSPSRVYMGGGTYALSWLQEIVSTLSLQNKARVVVITDACHAGKLAGSTIGGSAITGANLAKRYANEIKILSCQPEELSLEGKQWGGGRGIFSYHLIDGLYGLADRNGDGFVTVSELDRYLEDYVTEEAKPQSQVPLLLGNKTEQLSKVDAVALEHVKQRKAEETPSLSAVDTRGLEVQVLARVDSNIREDYNAFLAALQNKQFFEPAKGSGQKEGKSAEALYARLSMEPELAELHGYLKRNYAAALQDETQVAINDYLASDPQELRKRWSFDNRYDPFPKYLARAAELLGANHYLYKSLKAREHYFTGLNLRLRGEQEKDTLLFRTAIDLQLQTIQLDSNAAYGYNELGLLYRRLERNAPSAAAFEQAIVCSPQWVLPWTNLCSILTDMDQFERAIKVGKQALQIDSKYGMTHYNLGHIYQLQANYPLAKNHYQLAIQYAPNYALTFFNIGLIYYHEKNYTGAVEAWLDYSRLKPKDADVYLNLVFAKVELNELDAAMDFLEKALENGYRDLDNLETDAQLVEFRKLPRYDKLIKKYFPGKK